MGKRSDFPRRKNDVYMTPEKAVLPLLPHLPQRDFTFFEPCAGDGRLVRHLEKHSRGKCVGACDIDPLAEGITQRNALSLTGTDADFFITNPPWTRELLHPLIIHLADIKPTWFLFDADWLFTKQAAPYLVHLEKIVAVGRVRWMEGTTMDGKDNAAWYCFYRGTNHQTEFYGRVA